MQIGWVELFNYCLSNIAEETLIQKAYSLHRTSTTARSQFRLHQPLSSFQLASCKEIINIDKKM